MDIGFDLTPLVAAKLIIYSFGGLIHLFLMVLILGQRRLRRFEWLLFGLVSSVFLWNAGNLLSLNVALAYGPVLAPHLGAPQLVPFIGAIRFARLIPFIGAMLSVPLAVQAHLEYAFPRGSSGGRVQLARIPKRLLIAFFWAPLIATPWLSGRLLSRPDVQPLLALQPCTRLLVVWLVLALLISASLNLRLRRVSREGPVERLHGGLALAELVLATGLAWVYMIRPLPALGLGGYLPAFLMAVAVVPGALIGYSVFRYNLFDLQVQRSLIYSLVAIFALLIYLNFIRRLSGFLEERGILPSAVTEGLMIFLLVILLEPIKKWINRVLERAFRSDVERVQRLSAEIQEFAKQSGDLAALQRYVEDRVPAELGLERVKLDLGRVWQEVQHDRAPSRTRIIPIRRGDDVIALLGVVPREPELSGEQRGALQLLADQLAAAIELCQLIADKVRLERELADKAKMAFLGEMAARIAHNVKNPLSSMKTLVQLLDEDPSLSERARQDCRLIVSEIDRLNSNVSQVLRYAKPARDTDRPVDLVAVVARVVDVMRPEAERRRLRLEFEAPSGPRLVEGGDEAASDIVSNLMVNALEASSVDESPSSPWTERKVTVAINGAPRGASVLLSVDDQGDGVTPELKGRIFQPFFTTRPGGTGLGLAIVARRVEEIGGTVECISPIGASGGTRFVVRFRPAVPSL